MQGARSNGVKQQASTYSGDICQCRRKSYKVQRLLHETPPRSLKLDTGLKQAKGSATEILSAFFSRLFLLQLSVMREGAVKHQVGNDLDQQRRGCHKKQKKNEKRAGKPGEAKRWWRDVYLKINLGLGDNLSLCPITRYYSHPGSANKRWRLKER